MASSEVMLAPTTAPGTSRREMDDVRDVVRNATVTTVYVSLSKGIILLVNDSAISFVIWATRFTDYY